ncbi:MAG: hypothetical protein HYX41_01985 [Bdellovibrio sp.]|nr:hypothetical protein [Bdellovibrio sp.]
MRSPLIAFFILVLGSALLVSPTEASASDGKSHSKSDRQKVIDFEGDLVEGVNKRPWDSLSQISDKNARRRAHLYQKRRGFKAENRETLQEMRFQR